MSEDKFWDSLVKPFKIRSLYDKNNIVLTLEDKSVEPGDFIIDISRNTKCENIRLIMDEIGADAYNLLRPRSDNTRYKIREIRTLDGKLCQIRYNKFSKTIILTMDRYWRNRVYVRGTSWLGILNTITGALFNRVLVKHVDDDTENIIKWSIDKGTNFPPITKY